jgi:hypothetical protein
MKPGPPSMKRLFNSCVNEADCSGASSSCIIEDGTVVAVLGVNVVALAVAIKPNKVSVINSFFILNNVCSFN